jgi:DNA-binding CsgD family transcriptional regulator
MVRARTGRKDLGGRERRPHVTIILDGRSSTITAAVTLREQEVASVSLANGPGEAESGIGDADALLIGPAGFEALWSDDPFLFAATARRCRLLAVLEPAELLEIADLLPLADGWILVGSHARHLGEQLLLGLEGHALLPPVPSAVVGACRLRLSDGLRLLLLPDLTGMERRVLGRLASGLDDRTIAQTLGIDEAAVRRAVRAVLAKLHCRNRTEAAVFAWRYADAVAAGSAGQRPAPP